MSYKIVRHYFNKSSKRTIITGLTLKQAQKHCNNPETSSSTCTKPYPKSLTKKHGRWFLDIQKNNNSSVYPKTKASKYIRYLEAFFILSFLKVLRRTLFNFKIFFFY